MEELSWKSPKTLPLERSKLMLLIQFEIQIDLNIALTRQYHIVIAALMRIEPVKEQTLTSDQTIKTQHLTFYADSGVYPLMHLFHNT